MAITLQPADAIFAYRGGEKGKEGKGERKGKEGERQGRETVGEGEGTWNRAADWPRPALNLSVPPFRPQDDALKIWR